MDAKDLVARAVSSVLSVSPELLSETTSADDVDNWDSLRHMQIITAIEAEAGIQLSMQAIMESQNLGALAVAVQQELKSA